MTVPLTVLTPPAPREGDYLDTLEQWGSLPQYLPLPDAARLIGHKCKQNPSALLKILEEAVLDDAIPFAGMLSTGAWEPGMLRVWQRYQGKPRVKPNEEGAQVSVRLDSLGRLHSEAVGVRIGDAVALLAKRGRKIPDELRHLLRDATPAPTGTAAPSAPLSRQKHQEREILRTLTDLGYDPQRLPRAPAGTPGPKAEVRKKLPEMTRRVFEKAWERLRGFGDIAEAE